jgi:hypothetical protein
LINNTISGNVANSGGGIYTDSGNNTIANSIIWGNSSGIVNDGSTLTVTYSIVQQDMGVFPGANNLNIDPQFISPQLPGLSTGGNYRLKSTSPAINVGNNAAPNIFDPDLDGNARIVNGTIDLGAYEYFSLVCPGHII